MIEREYYVVLHTPKGEAYQYGIWAQSKNEAQAIAISHERLAFEVDGGLPQDEYPIRIVRIIRLDSVRRGG